uniref:Alfy-like armadillo-like repeat domain-containing protein n=1 Tax=Oryzias latipes TaxID=8090 RepID=H2LYT8_ORYLA
MEWDFKGSTFYCFVSFPHTDAVTFFFSAKNCVRICIQNLLNIGADVSGPVLAEVAVAVFSFIRDTYHLSPDLFTEFDSNNGYQALETILKRCEEGVCLEEFRPVEELLALIASFTFLGKAELKVALCVTNPQPPGFKFDPPLTKGSAVKNLPAFHLLQASMLRSNDICLCSQLLQTIHTIWKRDPANFFLLEWTVQSMTQLAACVWSKPPPVQELFFSIMTVHSSMLAEVLSDGGLLELLLGELRRRAKILRKAGPFSKTSSCWDCNLCYFYYYFCLSVSVSIRDLGMVPYIKIFLDEDQYRGPTLSILEQLAEINADEFMSTAIGALCSSTQQELRLKQDLLQSLQRVLENPNSWDAFRKAGGFTGLLSLVTDMEGALSDPPKGDVWRMLGHQQILELLLLTLHILALTVHLHTVNAHHFETGGFYDKLAEALLQLGCFHTDCPETENWDEQRCSFPKTAAEKQTPGRSFFEFVELADASVTNPSITPQPHLPVTLKACVRLLFYLEQFAIGTFFPQEFKFGQESCDGWDEETESQQGLTIIVHPGAVRIITTLLPKVFCAEDSQLSMDVQFSVAHHIQCLVKSERNRQIMCEGGLVSTLLTYCRSMLLTPNHPLHVPVTRILEKLSSQAITASDFRTFLRLGNPLMCLSNLFFYFLKLDQHTEVSGSSVKKLKRTFSLLEPSFGSSLPVHQIITLVSMTAPRTFRPHRLSSSPGFVEFDMKESGYGCLFLPSLATVKGVTANTIPTGGIGGDCRGFPPAAGLSFSCWFQINRFSSACDSHPVRLLSIVRHMSRTEQQYICLSVSFSANDGCLVISTEEEAFTYLDMMEPEVSTPTSLSTSLRFRCSSMLVPGQWHHLTVVMAKDMKKSCVTTAYFNGKAVGTGKMKYIQQFPGHYVSMDPTAVIDVYGVMGTPAPWKEHAALVWRVGPSYLFEEALSSEAVTVVYTQGTAYLGNFLALHNTGLDPDARPVPLRMVSEERISFGINPAVSTLTTVAQIREDYNEVDCRLIAKEMGITSRDQSTPVFLAYNISHHLSGTARTIGAALIGHFGVRKFIPSFPSNGFLYAGGPAVALSLVAMASDDSSLYAAVKVLLSVLETNSAMQQEMLRINGYKLLAFLLKMKGSLVSCRTLQLILCLSSSVELSCGTGCIQNVPAFQALLCDLEVNICKDLKCYDNKNAAVMHSVGLLPKLLFELTDPAITVQKVKIICCVVTFLLKAQLSPLDISRLGLFLVYTLPPSSTKTEINEMDDVALMQDTQQKTVFESLGSDWFLLFLQGHLHPSTLKLALVLLTRFLSCPDRRSSFREGVFLGTLADDLLSGTCPGFVLLQELLIKNVHLPQVYGALAALEFFLLSISLFVMLLFFLSEIDTQAGTPAQPLCADAAVLLLELVKPTCSAQLRGVTDESWRTQFPANVMQFLCLLHNLRPRDPLWVSSTFLYALVSAAFPMEASEVCVLLYKNQTQEGQMGIFMENVVVFSKTLLQNLYDGTFAGDSQTLLHFLADQILAVRQLQSLYCFKLMVIWIIYNVRHVCTLFFF